MLGWISLLPWLWFARDLIQIGTVCSSFTYEDFLCSYGMKRRKCGTVKKWSMFNLVYWSSRTQLCWSWWVRNNYTRKNSHLMMLPNETIPGWVELLEFGFMPHAFLKTHVGLVLLFVLLLCIFYATSRRILRDPRQHSLASRLLLWEVS